MVGFAGKLLKQKHPRLGVLDVCRQADSNRRPTHFQCVALPAELQRRNDGKYRRLMGGMQDRIMGGENVSFSHEGGILVLTVLRGTDII